MLEAFSFPVLLISTSFTGGTGGSSGGVCATIDGISNPGGNIDFVSGPGMQIISDDGNNNITFSTTERVSTVDKMSFQFDSTAGILIGGLETFDCVHSFNTPLPLLVQVWEQATGRVIIPNRIEMLDNDTVRVGFAPNPGDILVSVVLIDGGGITEDEAITIARRQALLFG